MNYIPLTNRGVISLHGPDTKYFLQNIVTNDINKLSKRKAIYSLLLNPHGKYLYDFFLIEDNEYILLECESVYVNEIIKKLDLLKTCLRVRIKDISSLYRVGVLPKTELPRGISISEIVFQDPRHEFLGMRILHKEKIKESVGDFFQYERVRIQNLIVDGAKDMVQNSSFPLQYLIDKINGISFSKGCYIGQEVVNRMRRQEKFRRKLHLVKGKNALPGIGTKIIDENGKEVGELRSSVDNIGLALLNTEKSHSSLCTDGVRIFVH